MLNPFYDVLILLLNIHVHSILATNTTNFLMWSELFALFLISVLTIPNAY